VEATAVAMGSPRHAQGRVARRAGATQTSNGSAVGMESRKPRRWRKQLPEHRLPPHRLQGRLRTGPIFSRRHACWWQQQGGHCTRPRRGLFRHGLRAHPRYREGARVPTKAFGRPAGGKRPSAPASPAASAVSQLSSEQRDGGANCSEGRSLRCKPLVARRKALVARRASAPHKDNAPSACNREQKTVLSWGLGDVTSLSSKKTRKLTLPKQRLSPKRLAAGAHDLA